MLNLDESSEALHRNLKEKEKENRNLERRYRNEKSDWKRNVKLYSWVQGLLRLLLTQKKRKIVQLFSFVLERNWSFRIHVCCFSYHLSAVPLSPVSLSDSRNDEKTSQLELRRAWSGKGPSSRSSFFTIVAVTILGGAWNRWQYSSHFMCWNICHVTSTPMFIHVSPIWNVNHPRNWYR